MVESVSVNLRLSCSMMRTLSWSRTVLRMRSLPADKSLRSFMVKTLSLTIKWRSKIEWAWEEKENKINCSQNINWMTHVVLELRHKQLLVNWWEFIFQALPCLVARHKVRETGRRRVQLLVKSIACSEPQRIAGWRKEKEKEIQNGIYGWNVTFIESGSSCPFFRWSTYFNIGSVFNFSKTDVYGMPRTWSMMWTKPLVAAMSDWIIVALTPPPSTVTWLLL